MEENPYQSPASESVGQSWRPPWRVIAKRGLVALCAVASLSLAVAAFGQVAPAVGVRLLVLAAVAAALTVIVARYFGDH
jgi:uncharacterized membrane-anchored protein